MYSKRIVKEYITDAPDPISIKNKISGTINEADTEDRTIWAYDRNDGELLGSTIINRDTRQWELYLDPTHNDESITLICRDESGNFNCDAFDRVSLCLTEYPYQPGITTFFTYPELLLADGFPRPQTFNDICTVEVPELKGDIAKVVQVGDISNRTYTIKYVNSSGSEIVNDVTSNNVIVNDNSVILNKKTLSFGLGSWKKDIFEDGSEILHPVWDGRNWKNYHSNVPFEIQNSSDAISSSCCRGKFEEPAICMDSKLEDYAHLGIACNIDTSDTTVMSISFWHKSNGFQGGSLGGYTVSAIFGLINVCSIFNLDNDDNLFSFGVRAYSNSWTSIEQDTKYFITAKNCSVNTSEMTLANNSFYDWHHFVITYTAATLNIYIDRNLVKTLTFASTQIGNAVKIVLGKLPKYHTSVYSHMASRSGVYSNLRVFNKIVNASEIDTLYNDTPFIEKEVISVKGMEYDKGLLCLGGVPYTPVLSSDKYIYTYQNGYTSQVFLKDFNLPNSSGNGRSFSLNSDSIRFIYNSSTAGARTGLSSRPDNDGTQDMGIDIANIDVYFRVRLSSDGYVLKLGNTSKAVSFYWYNNSNGFRVYYPNEDGSRASFIGVAKAADVRNKWIRVLWIQDKLYVYEDDGTTLIQEKTINNYSIASSTVGQISVGCNRAGCMDDAGESYGGRCEISDVYIYEAGKMNTDEPLLKYEFGYNRDGLAGLYTHENHQANVQSTTINYDIPALNSIGIHSSSDQYGNFDNIKQAVAGVNDGFSLLLYYAINSGEVSVLGSNGANFFRANAGSANQYPMFSIGTRGNDRRVQSDVYALSRTNSYTSNTSIPFATRSGISLDTWNHVGISVSYNEYLSNLYLNGIPLRYDNVPTPPYMPEDTSNASTCIVGNNGVSLAEIMFYDRQLPMSSFRNATQNIDGVCYKNDMLVAFINENTPYPIYSNTPLTKIKVDGDDNGQVLTFACTKNHTDYYVFTTEWVKILMQNGTMWQYWDGSVWQSGGMVKWSALAMAMDIAANRMSLDKLNSLSALQLNTLHDLNNGTFDLAVGMKSDGSVSPYIDRITYNNERVWVSPVYDLADFSDTDYITKIYLSKILSVGQTDGIKLFVHHSNELGWQECQNFSEVPGIVKNTTNTGTVQFKVTFDQSKDNGKETALLKVTIK